MRLQAALKSMAFEGVQSVAVAWNPVRALAALAGSGARNCDEIRGSSDACCVALGGLPALLSGGRGFCRAPEPSAVAQQEQPRWLHAHPI
jgi:hypothetical protein